MDKFCLKKTIGTSIILFVVFFHTIIAWGNSFNKASEWPFSEPILYIKGGVNAITDGGQLVLWAVGDTISVIDKTSFSQLSTFRVNTSTTVEDMLYDTATSTLYVAAGYDSKSGSGGLQVFTLTDPSSPALIGAYYKSTSYPGSVKTDDYGGSKTVPDIDARGLGLHNTTLFLADDNYGLRVFNVSDPTNPSEIPLTTQTTDRKSGYKQPDINGSFLATGGYIGLNVYPYNGKIYAFVLDYYQGIDIFDVTDPAVIDDPLIMDTRTAFWFGSVSLNSDIFVTETNGRLTTYLSATNYDDTLHAITRLDTTFNESKPMTIFGYCEDLPSYTRGLTVSGNYAYVADSASGLQIVNISEEPATSGQKIEYPIAGTYTSNVKLSYSVMIDNTILYLASGESGLDKLDVTSPASPAFQANLPSPLSTDDVFVSSDTNYTYMLDRNVGLRIFNTSVPEYPLLRGFLGNTAPESLATDFCVTGTYAYIAYTTGIVKIADVSDPDAPVFVNNTIAASSPQSLAVSGNTLFIAEGGSKHLRTINITNPAIPEALGTVNTEGNALSVCVSGSRAYVSEGTTGLEIFNVADPANPVLLTKLPLTDARSAVTYSSSDITYLLVADGSSGLKIQNVSDLSSIPDPVTFNNMGTTASPASFTAITVATSGNSAFIGMGTDGVLALDMSSPQSPSIIARYLSSCSSSDLYAYQIYDSTLDVTYNYVTVADGSAGLKILYAYNGSSIDPTPLPSIDSGCFIDTSLSGGRNGWVSITISHITRLLNRIPRLGFNE
jgi:hypothetical protein